MPAHPNLCFQECITSIMLGEINICFLFAVKEQLVNYIWIKKRLFSFLFLPIGKKYVVLAIFLGITNFWPCIDQLFSSSLTKNRQVSIKKQDIVKKIMAKFGENFANQNSGYSKGNFTSDMFCSFNDIWFIFSNIFSKFFNNSTFLNFSSAPRLISMMYTDLKDKRVAVWARNITMG